MGREMNRKGLSPVIATVLLIAITMVLAVIIFIWASSFITEGVEKFGEPVENSCDDVKFRAEADTAKLFIVNEGSVPIYGLDIKKRSEGGTSSIGSDSNSDETGRSIFPGAGENAEISLDNFDNGVSDGDELILVPIILGESSEAKIIHTCDDQYGVLITVEA